MYPTYFIRSIIISTANDWIITRLFLSTKHDFGLSNPTTYPTNEAKNSAQYTSPWAASLRQNLRHSFVGPSGFTGPETTCQDIQEERHRLANFPFVVLIQKLINFAFLKTLNRTSGFSYPPPKVDKFACVHSPLSLPHRLLLATVSSIGSLCATHTKP